MRPAPLRLKRASGWFAAGREVAEALALLSDASFKLFLWLCLQADRSRGALRVEPKEMAAALGKTEAEVTAILEDLFLKGICRRIAAGWIEITDRFWPYQRSPTAPVPANAAAYVAQVKQLMLERACVRASFAAADQKLALQLHQRGVPLQRVERAIHLGCLRKYAALLNHQGGTPITSLHYFTLLFGEVERLAISEDYWGYVALKLEKLETKWCQAPPTSGWDKLGATETK
jgi:hypothetical protein